MSILKTARQSILSHSKSLNVVYAKGINRGFWTSSSITLSNSSLVFKLFTVLRVLCNPLPFSVSVFVLFESTPPKKKMTLLTIPGSNAIPIPTKTHLVGAFGCERLFPGQGSAPVKVISAFEYSSSNSSGSGTLLDHQVFWIFFHDDDYGEGLVIPPRFVPRIRIDREEVPLCSTRFESKMQKRQLFNKWAGRLRFYQGWRSHSMKWESWR